MSVVNAVPFLSNSSGSDADALALKVFMNNYVEAPRTSIFLYNKNGAIFRGTPEHGKQFQFLMDADLPAAEEFVPGNELLGQMMAVAEGTIDYDKYIVAHHWIGKDRLNISHFQPQTSLGARQRRMIEREIDRRLFIQIVKAARTAAVTDTRTGLSVHSGGNRVTRTGTSITNAYPASSTGASNFRADLKQLRRQFDEDNIGDYAELYTNPNIRESLSYDTSAQLWSSDYQPGADINTRLLPKIDGFTPMGFPNRTSNGGPLPSQDLTHANSKFTIQASVKVGDTTNGEPVAIAIGMSETGGYAAAVLELAPIIHVAKYYEEKMSWLFYSAAQITTGVMHPWAAGVIEAVSAS